MKNAYGLFLGVLVVTGMIMIGCTSPAPQLPVNASDGVGSSITVDWSNWVAAGAGLGPYTVNRASNPSMQGATPVATNHEGTSLEDTTASENTAYFYSVNDGSEDSPAEGGHWGTLTESTSTAWEDAANNARAYFLNELEGYTNPDPCPAAVELPYAACTSGCPDGSGTLTQSALPISGTDYYNGSVTFDMCRSGDHVIDGTLQGPLTNLGAGYVIGLQVYTDLVVDDADGDLSGQSYTAITNEILSEMTDPSTSYATRDDWATAIFNDLMD
jgi:hypothetical protein